MLIGDILHLVGAHELNTFEWGAAFVDVLNKQLREHVVDDQHLLTPDSTGVDARAALFVLPPVEMAAFVLKTFDLGSRTLVDDEPVAIVQRFPEPMSSDCECPPPARCPIPPVDPVTPPISVQPALPGAAVPVIAGAPPTVVVSIMSSLSTKAKSNLALIMGGTLVFVTLLLAVAMSVTTVKQGEMPDASALNTVTQILGDVIKSYMQPPAPPTPGE